MCTRKPSIQEVKNDSVSDGKFYANYQLKKKVNKKQWRKKTGRV